MSIDPKNYLHDYQSAAFWHAIALRRLCAYRAARDKAKQHGDDLAALIEPPSYSDLSDAYVRLIEEYVDQSIDNPNVARCALDLLGAIAQDLQFFHIFEDGSVVSRERDIADQIRLVEVLSGWINKLDIAEGIAEERRRLPLDDEHTANLRARAEAIAAEFDPAKKPLPAGDAGLIEAERRLKEFQLAMSALARKFAVGFKLEEEVVIPIRDPVNDALCDFPGNARGNGGRRHRQAALCARYPGE